ncbi:SWIM zinc finger family protein [Cohnella sp. 56]|uniref:SWIM zinc finger family protein n=1 Tax=Cohnella sp. 56 TaxID=3113722 RepID=UPI0030E77FC0
MDSYTKLNDAAWDRLLRSVAKQFTDVTLKRGYQYYKQGRVTLDNPDDLEHLEAEVDGTIPYVVDVYPGKPSDSDCNCPVGSSCKHIAAVLMAWAEHQGRSVQSLANARTAAVSVPAAAPRYKAEAQRLAQEAVRIPEMSVAQWLALFERCLMPIADQVRNTNYAKQALGLIYKLKPELPPAAERLYELNALLYLMHHVAEPPNMYARGQSSYLGYFTHIAITDLHEAAMGCLARELPDAAADEPHWRDRLLETADALRTAMLRPGPTQDYDLLHYGGLWETWVSPSIGSEALYAEELRRLEDALPELPPQSRGAWNTAALRMRFSLSDDDGALALLREGAGRNRDASSSELVDLLASLARDGQWSRLLRWLTEAAPWIASRRPRDMEAYASLWDALVARLPEAEPLMWETFERMLPASGQLYESRLLAAGRYEEWMDIQLSYGREPLEYRATELAPLEKHAPHTLLPFYHQAVERYVALKNRAGYKSAVKLLKRLAKLYKKMKREDRWETFYELFELRHSRLRALQEELRKGKLS